MGHTLSARRGGSADRIACRRNYQRTPNRYVRPGADHLQLPGRRRYFLLPDSRNRASVPYSFFPDRLSAVDRLLPVLRRDPLQICRQRYTLRTSPTRSHRSEPQASAAEFQLYALVLPDPKLIGESRGNADGKGVPPFLNCRDHTCSTYVRVYDNDTCRAINDRQESRLHTVCRNKPCHTQILPPCVH